MIIKFRKCAPKEPENSINVVLLPFQGVISNCFYTQGAALGYMLLPFLAPRCYASVSYVAERLIHGCYASVPEGRAQGVCITGICL